MLFTDNVAPHINGCRNMASRKITMSICVIWKWVRYSLIYFTRVSSALAWYQPLPHYSSEWSNTSPENQHTHTHTHMHTLRHCSGQTTESISVSNAAIKLLKTFMKWNTGIIMSYDFSIRKTSMLDSQQIMIMWPHREQCPVVHSCFSMYLSQYMI